MIKDNSAELSLSKHIWSYENDLGKKTGFFGKKFAETLNKPERI